MLRITNDLKSGRKPRIALHNTKTIGNLDNPFPTLDSDSNTVRIGWLGEIMIEHQLIMFGLPVA